MKKVISFSEPLKGDYHLKKGTSTFYEGVLHWFSYLYRSIFPLVVNSSENSDNQIGSVNLDLIRDESDDSLEIESLGSVSESSQKSVGVRVVRIEKVDQSKDIFALKTVLADCKVALEASGYTVELSEGDHLGTVKLYKDGQVNAYTVKEALKVLTHFHENPEEARLLFHLKAIVRKYFKPIYEQSDIEIEADQVVFRFNKEGHQSVQIPVSSLLGLHDDRHHNSKKAKDCLIKFLAPLALAQITVEAAKLAMPHDGYDEAALLIKSSGISDYLVWFINLSIFGAGSALLYKYGVMHAYEEIKEAHHQRTHLLELYQQQKVELARDPNNEVLKAMMEKTKQDLIDTNWEIADASIEFLSLSSMMGGTLSGVAESIALAVKTFGTGALSSSAEAAMGTIEIVGHSFLALGSILTIYSGIRTMITTKNDVAEWQEKKDQLKDSIETIRDRLKQLEDELKATDSVNTEKLRKERDDLNQLITFLDETFNYISSEAFYTKTAGYTRGATLASGGLILGAFNLGHVLVDAGLLASIQAPLEGPFGIAALCVGVVLVLLGVSIHLAGEGRKKQEMFIDHAMSHMGHRFHQKREQLDVVLNLFGIDEANKRKAEERVARKVALDEKKLAERVLQLRTQLSVQLSSKKPMSLFEIERLTDKKLSVGHGLKYMPFFGGKGALSVKHMKTSFKPVSPVQLSECSPDLSQDERYPWLISRLLDKVSVDTGSLGQLGMSSGTESKLELSRKWFGFLSETGSWDFVLMKMAKKGYLSEEMKSFVVKKRIVSHKKRGRFHRFFSKSIAKAGNAMFRTKYFNDTNYTQAKHVKVFNEDFFHQLFENADLADEFLKVSGRIYFKPKAKTIDHALRGAVVAGHRCFADPMQLIDYELDNRDGHDHHHH